MSDVEHPSDADPKSKPDAGAADGEPDAPKRRRWPWIVLGVFLVLGAATALFGPYVIASIARSTLVSAADDEGFDLELARCDFGWTSGLSIEGLRATERIEHGLRVEVASIDVVPSWSGLVRGRVHLDRVAVDRPLVVVDPARREPWPGTKPKPGAKEPAPGGGKGKGKGDGGGSSLERIAARLEVTGAAIRVLPVEGRPGLALEECDVTAHFDGATGQATSKVAGRFVTGNRRDPLEMVLDLTLPPDGSAPRGEGTFQVGGIDLAVLGPLAQTPQRIESGILRASGRLRTVDGPEGAPVVAVEADAQVADLRVREGERLFEESDVRLRFEGAIERVDRVRIAKATVRGLPLELDAGGVVSLAGARPSFTGDVATRGSLGDLGAFLPPGLSLAGRIDGRLDVVERDGAMIAKGGVDLVDLAADRDGKALLREPKARVDVDMRVAIDDAASATGTVTLRGSGVEGGVDITESSLAASTGKARVTMKGTIEAVRARSPMLDENESVRAMSGAFDAAWDIDATAERIRATGGADLTDVKYAMDGRTIAEPKARLDTDVTLRPVGDVTAADGTATVKGTASTLEAKFTSEALPAVAIDATMTADPARALAQGSFALPAGFVAGGELRSTWSGRLDPAKETDWMQGKFALRGATLQRAGVSIDEVVIDGEMVDQHIKIPTFDARVNGGRVSLRADLQLGKPAQPMDVALEVKGVGITQTIASLVRYVVPIYALPEGVDAQVGGAIDATFNAKGPMPTTIDELAGLVGGGSAKVVGGHVSGSPLVQQVLMATKGKAKYAFDTVTTAFKVREGNVIHDSLTVKDRELAWGFKGKTGFDQAIDYTVDPGPLVERLYRGRSRDGKLKTGDKILKALLSNMEKFPIGVGGTLMRPTLKLSDISSLGGIEGDLGKALGGALDGLLGGKKKRKK